MLSPTEPSSRNRFLISAQVSFIWQWEREEAERLLPPVCDGCGWPIAETGAWTKFVVVDARLIVRQLVWEGLFAGTRKTRFAIPPSEGNEVTRNGRQEVGVLHIVR